MKSNLTNENFFVLNYMVEINIWNVVNTTKRDSILSVKNKGWTGKNHSMALKGHSKKLEN